MLKIHGIIQDIAAMGSDASTGEFGYYYSHQVRVDDTIYSLNPDSDQLKLLYSAKTNRQPITLSIPYWGRIETLLNHTTQEKLSKPVPEPEDDEAGKIFMEIYSIFVIFLIICVGLYLLRLGT